MSVKAILQTKGASVLSITSEASVAEAVTMLAKHRIEKIESEAEAMRSYIQSA